MWTKSSWDLTQQTISATKETMQVLHNFKNESYQNISVGIQLKPKTKVVDDPVAFRADATKIQRYVNIFGMVETFKNQTYGPFDTDINEDIQQTSVVDIYDTNTKAWLATTQLSEARSNMMASEIRGKVYFTGGVAGYYSQVYYRYELNIDDRRRSTTVF